VLVVLQMIDMVVSMMVSFPKGASWNLRNVYGSVYGSRGHIRLDIWMAIVGVMGVCQAGQEPFAKRRHCSLELYQ